MNSAHWVWIALFGKVTMSILLETSARLGCENCTHPAGSAVKPSNSTAFEFDWTDWRRPARHYRLGGTSSSPVNRRSPPPASCQIVFSIFVVFQVSSSAGTASNCDQIAKWTAIFQVGENTTMRHSQINIALWCTPVLPSTDDQSGANEKKDEKNENNNVSKTPEIKIQLIKVTLRRDVNLFIVRKIVFVISSFLFLCARPQSNRGADVLLGGRRDFVLLSLTFFPVSGGAKAFDGCLSGHGLNSWCGWTTPSIRETPIELKRSSDAEIEMKSAFDRVFKFHSARVQSQQMSRWRSW